MPGFASSLSNKNDVVFAKNGDFTLSPEPDSQNGLISNGQLWIGHTDANLDAQHVFVGTITSPNNSITIGYSSPNITAQVNTGVVTDLHVARYIVSANGLPDGANFTTIASAITAAAAAGGPQVVFIQPGVYVENLTLQPNVSLASVGSYSLNSTNSVTIRGNCTFTQAGSVQIFGIQLETNGAALLTISGIDASVVTLNNCFLNITNSTGIIYSSSSANSRLFVINCLGNLAFTGIAYHTITSAGATRYINCFFANTGNSTTASTLSSGSLLLYSSTFNGAFSTSLTGAMVLEYSTIDTSVINTTSLIHNGTGTASTTFFSILASGLASTISSGAGATVNLNTSTIGSSATNALTGLGLIRVNNVTYTGPSFKNNATTSTGGIIIGLTQGTPPSAGFVGEQIISTVAQASAISLGASPFTATSITSIALTAGIWDISAIGGLNLNGATVTAVLMAINSSVASGTPGDNTVFFFPGSPGLYDGYGSIPAFRVTLAASATYFLVMAATYSVAVPKGFGRISATRVG